MNETIEQIIESWKPRTTVERRKLPRIGHDRRTVAQRIDDSIALVVAGPWSSEQKAASVEALESLRSQS
jgi:hypothetical protein